ncbi:MAG: polysaccharide lyase family 1 protein [Myxococcales bacterium]|nr:polysaccharide lyase family 1 protein [Myxococcales bacterium]
MRLRLLAVLFLAPACGVMPTAEVGPSRRDAGVAAEPADAGQTSADDAGPLEPVDAGVSEPDAGELVDAGQVVAEPPDAGSTRLDAGVSRPDAGQPTADAGRPGDVHLGTGVHPSENCMAYPFSAQALLAEREGFGAATTGGDPTRVYRVTSSSGSTGAGTLRTALESTDPYWIVFDASLSGRTITFTRIEVKSNKTIDGRGRDITLRGHLNLQSQRNVIISDVKLTNDTTSSCTQAGDVVTVRGPGGALPTDFPARNIWLHHVELFHGGDGLFDVRGGSNITLSWAHLHTHDKALLHAADENNAPVPGMRVTYHHNFFDRLTRRGPHLAYGGKGHFFNNYQYQWFEYGAAAVQGAELYSEGNVYEALPGTTCVLNCPRNPNPCGDDVNLQIPKLAVSVDWAAGGSLGLAKSVNDLVLEGAQITERLPTQVFSPATFYSYTAEPANAALVARLRAGTGPRARYCR